MGTDMRAFIEYDEASGVFVSSSEIYCLTQGSFSCTRNYELFDALAGGREACLVEDERNPSRGPKFQTRGMPCPVSLNVAHEYYFLVDDPINPAAPPNERFWRRENCIDPIEAERLVKEEGSSESQVEQWFNVVGKCLWRVVSRPHFRTATWLWPDEFDASLAEKDIDLESVPVDYTIIRIALGELEKRFGNRHARLILWFDD